MAIVRERAFEIADPTIFPASASELHGLGGPMDELYGARRFDQFLVDEGGFGPGLGWLGELGANCPEGSSRATSYTGPLGPDGCRCAAGRVWHNGRCQSPQSVGQQAGASAAELTAQYGTGTGWATQPLTAAARQYLQMTGHRVDCKILRGAQTPVGSAEWMACSIDGGLYEHGAYAINLSPEAAVVSVQRQRAAAAVAQAAGVAPGAVYSTPELAAQVTAAMTPRTAEAQQGPPPATSGDSGQFQPQWFDEVIPISGMLEPAGGDTVLPGVTAWNLPGGGTQYEVFGVDVPQVVTQEWIAGIPNWLLLAAALGAGYVAFKD